ncbi:unnamed protein product [Sphagnum troendelagicum]|uniref:Uncharacterized protein n=1 Tax=Sphagnum troendelagicum TaxID=128251 RepID=A0ABP0TR25_9BRYO
MHFTQLSSTALARSGPRGPVLDDYSLTSWMRNTWSTLHLSPLRVTCLRCRCWTPTSQPCLPRKRDLHG